MEEVEWSYCQIMKVNFKIHFFSEVATKLGIKHSTSSLYRPKANGYMEASHKFPKNYIRKLTVKGEVEWYEVLHITYATWNFFYMTIARKQHFSLFFLSLLQPKLWYLRDRSSFISIDLLRDAFMLAAINLKRAGGRPPVKRTTFKVRDLVLQKNHKKQNWDNKYMPNFDICKVVNDRAYDQQCCISCLNEGKFYCCLYVCLLLSPKCFILSVIYKCTCLYVQWWCHLLGCIWIFFWLPIIPWWMC